MEPKRRHVEVFQKLEKEKNSKLWFYCKTIPNFYKKKGKKLHILYCVRTQDILSPIFVSFVAPQNSQDLNMRNLWQCSNCILEIFFVTSTWYMYVCTSSCLSECKWACVTSPIDACMSLSSTCFSVSVCTNVSLCISTPASSTSVHVSMCVCVCSLRVCRWMLALVS